VGTPHPLCHVQAFQIGTPPTAKYRILWFWVFLMNFRIMVSESFAKEHGYENVDKVELNELLPILDDKYFGAKEFKELLNKTLEE
jgi:hypothetical protein